MRGDIDTRRGVTKVILVALVYGMVTSSSLYTNYVQTTFETTLPNFIADLGGDFGTQRADTIPEQLDLAFDAGEAGFLLVSKAIPPNDELDSLAFEGAQLFFYFCLWTIFGIYDTINILMDVMITLGPLFLIGFLFDATKDIAVRWIGQLLSFSILYLLTSIVATTVVMTILAFMTATFSLAAAGKAIPVVGTAAGQLIGLYEIDLFIMTGAALVTALPAIASSLGGGAAMDGAQAAQSFLRRFGGSKEKKVSQGTIHNLSMTK
jgi:type IV secretion system protein VirB6